MDVLACVVEGSRGVKIMHGLQSTIKLSIRHGFEAFYRNWAC